MTPLERAARALCTNNILVRDCSEPDALPVIETESYDDLTEVERTAAMSRVRAVLAAIREPSSAMTHAAQSESHVAGDCEVDYHGIWASMIDAMLEEGA